MSVVTIGSLVVTNWQSLKTTVRLRIIALSEFVTTDGKVVQAGSPDSGPIYQIITCTPDLNAKTLTIPAFKIDTTTDSLTNQGAKYAAFFYSGSVRIGPYQGFTSFAVPPVLTGLSPCSPLSGSSVCFDWGALQVYNSAFIPVANDQTYTKAQINALLSGVGGVTSFNSRTGPVSPATNDYSFAQLSGLAAAAQLPLSGQWTVSGNLYLGNGGGGQVLMGDPADVGPAGDLLRLAKIAPAATRMQWMSFAGGTCTSGAESQFNYGINFDIDQQANPASLWATHAINIGGLVHNLNYQEYGGIVSSVNVIGGGAAGKTAFAYDSNLIILPGQNKANMFGLEVIFSHSGTDVAGRTIGGFKAYNAGTKVADNIIYAGGVSAFDVAFQFDNAQFNSGVFYMPTRPFTVFASGVGIGTVAPNGKFVVVGSSEPYTDAPNAGLGMLRLSTGTGLNTNESLIFGVHDGDYSWMQAIAAGVAARLLYLNPAGGSVQMGGNLTIDGGALVLNGFTFAGLGTPANGTIRYCSDCKDVSHDGAAAGSVAVNGGGGAFVFREQGAWIIHY